MKATPEAIAAGLRRDNQGENSYRLSRYTATRAEPYRRYSCPGTSCGKTRHRSRSLRRQLSNKLCKLCCARRWPAPCRTDLPQDR